MFKGKAIYNPSGRAAALLVFLMISLSAMSQCGSYRGIMGNMAPSVPETEMSIGYNTSNILKVDVNHLFENGMVFGISVGGRPYKTTSGNTASFASNLFLGYKIKRAVIIGATAGITEYTNYMENVDGSMNKSVYNRGSLGMAVKFIMSGFVVGGYASTTGTGVSFGILF